MSNVTILSLLSSGYGLPIYCETELCHSRRCASSLVELDVYKWEFVVSK